MRWIPIGENHCSSRLASVWYRKNLVRYAQFRLYDLVPIAITDRVREGNRWEKRDILDIVIAQHLPLRWRESIACEQKAIATVKGPYGSKESVGTTLSSP